jgi:hypothetical protein
MSTQLKKSNDVDRNKIPTSGRVINKKRNVEKKIKSSCDEALKKEQNNLPTIFSKRKKLFITIISISVLLVIAGVVLIIGHFQFGWFMKKNDLVLVQNREVNLVARYLEKKYSTNYYDLEGLDLSKRTQNNTILTDFVVGINKRTKINSIFDLSEPDYLYESFLLIINFTEINETNSEYLGGVNILDESKSAEDLIRINDELFLKKIQSSNQSNFTNKTEFKDNFPICKFYYFENGTIHEIYFPEGMNEFYKSAISDLIEKITPKLSKSLYQKETNKRRLENGGEESSLFNYQQIIENGVLQKTIIYEDKIQNEFYTNSNESSLSKNVLNSKIIRTFNSSGDITSLEMKGEALFKSFVPDKNNETKNKENASLRFVSETEEKNLETNESYYKLGFNEFDMNVTSNMELIHNEIDPKILKKLNVLSNLISFEKYKELNETLANNTGKENNLNNSDTNSTSEKRNLAMKSRVNFLSSYTATNKLINTDFLGTKIGLNQYLYINNKTNLRQEYLKLIFRNKEYTLSVAEKYHYSNLKSGSYNKELVNKNFGLDKNFKPFGFFVRGYLNLNIYAKHGVSFDIINEEMYAKGYANFEISVSGTFGPDFFFVSFGAQLTGYVAKGNSHIQANTLINSGSKLSQFYFYEKINACSVDLSFYFTINLIFWKKTYRKTFNLFKGFSSQEGKYLYG